MTFRTWAPNATTVTVAGEFNNWTTTANPLFSEGTSGVWSVDLPGASAGQEYKYVINNACGGSSPWPRDPRNREVDTSSGNSIIYNPNAFFWNGDNFTAPPLNDAVVYELHVGTFNNPNNNTNGTFYDAINKLDQLQQLGISVVEVMPIVEFPTTSSWGYNPSDPFAVDDGAYGGPDGLKNFVLACHQRGIAVVLDTVHNHYGPDNLPLWDFDCSAGPGTNGGGIYFYQQDGLCCSGFGPRPDYSRPQVATYIQDNFRMWLDEYHMDGFRWDTPYVMMNATNGGTNIFIQDAETLIQQINSMIDTQYTGKINIAEDSGWVSGFDAQWASDDFQGNLVPQLTTGDDGSRDMSAVSFAVNEGITGFLGFGRVLFTEDHDSAGDLNGPTHLRVPSAVDGGDPASYYARKRSTLGATLALTAPGIPMLLEGQEMLTTNQFGTSNPLDWTRANTYSGIVWLYKDLIRLRRNLDGLSSGLKGGNVSLENLDNTTKLIAFRRWNTGSSGDDVVVVANFANASRTGYMINFPKSGTWYAHFNSDSTDYGSDYGNFGSATVVASGNPASAAINIAPYSALIFSQVPPPPSPATPTNLTATAVSTNQINLAWSTSSGATSYVVKRSGVFLTMTSATNYSDSGLVTNTPYCYTVAATEGEERSADSAPVCAKTLIPPFTLDGTTNNYPGYLLSNPGMTLYAAVRGTILYVATISPGTNGPNDHFVLISDQLLASATTAAQWAKAGSIAIPPFKPFLAGESQSSYVGWQQTTASNQAVKAATNSGQMQGTIDLVQAFGAMPSTIYLSAAAYGTADGGALVAQAPAGNGNGNIESNEFLAVPIAAITDSTGDGVFDSLDPTLGFVIRSVQPSAGGFTVNWPAVPGKTYQVMSCNAPGGTWTNMGAPLTAGNSQTTLSYIDTTASSATQRFYKITPVP